ncbi:hypothetical protein DL768_008640 [Monosporascus sp. mg162]|nr:hypothetical protein DL768_008640 [Monosporascus sp. mg162]
MTTPIAVVGMSCRLSGHVSTLDDFWTLVSRSRDGWCPIPEDRMSSDAYYHPNPQKGGCFNQKGGYFMKHDLSRFDAPFFHITKQEAIAMDPQQRQLLECTYEALENAGFPKESISGSSMGVFIGGRSSDYRVGTLRDLHQVPMFDATGNHQGIQAGRISYYFDLRGPCFAVDTACSSSLYALHQAVQSIRSGESDSAVVAGCNLHLNPDDTVSMSMLGIFNDAGRTFAFDHRAKSGFARGEGVGCLILKPLDQAIRDNDKIRSVIVNTGVNQDGKTVGNGEAQEKLIRQVYARANISPEDTGFVEAHGTGTKVGDPIEAGAIYRVFGNGRTKRSPLYVGSVKTNFGHLENASGIISVIKATMMLEKGFILPNVNFQKANEAIPLAEWNMKVPVNIRPWPQDKKYISINNFGFGGSNAHVVLERPPFAVTDLPQRSRNERPQLFVLSGYDEGAAKRIASQVAIYIEQHPEIFQKRLLRDIAYTLGERRSHLPWRIALTASSLDELATSLNSPAAIPRRVTGTPKLAFVYTGQGAQWPRMGQELIETYPVFASTIRSAADCLARLGADFDLLQELSKGKESIVGKAHISQPVCTAIQLGLTALLSSWGVHPSMVLGHSSGEIGAAYAAGAISIDDAMAVAYYRGQVASKMKEKHPGLRGAMLAVGAGSDDVKLIIKHLGLENVTVACENSPSSATISGDEDAIDALAAELHSRSIFNRKLRVDVAYHSSHMKLVADEYLTTIKDVTSKVGNGDVTFYSSLLGHRSTTGDLVPSYWVDNLTNSVLFSTALRELYEESKPEVIVDIGPHPALEGPIKQVLKGIGPEAASGVKYMASLVRNQHDTAAMLKLAGTLFTHGYSVDFRAVNLIDIDEEQRPLLISDFQPYPWSDHRFWFESRSSKQHRLKPFARHDLLGTLDDAYSDVEPTWRNVLSSDEVPWLKGHQMQWLTTFPLAGYLCMAVEAAAQIARLRGFQPDQIAGFRLREIEAPKALILEDGTQYETAVSLRPYAEGTKSYSSDWDEFRISSWTSSRGWLEHCRGLVSMKKQISANPVNNSRYRAARARRQSAMNTSGRDLPLKEFYEELHEFGAGYTGAFTLQEGASLKICDTYATSSVAVPDTSSTMHSNYETPSMLPAAFTDLFFQLPFSILGSGQGKLPSLFMPSAIKEIDINGHVPRQPGEQLEVVAHGCPDFSHSGLVDFYIDAWRDSPDLPVVSMTGVKMTPVHNDSNNDISPRSICYKVQWQPLSRKGTENHVPNGLVLDSDPQEAIGTEATTTERVNGYHETPVSCVSGSNVVLVTDRDTSDSLVSALVQHIDLQTGCSPSVTSLSSVMLYSENSYIFLSELDAPVLHNISRESFEKVQSLLLICKSLLWVTAGAYRFAEKPQNNLAQGLLRTIRSETGRPVATLDLDPRSQLGAVGQAELIFTTLEAFVAPPLDKLDIETEFAEEGGQLVVPRIVEQDDMSLAVFRETHPSVMYEQDFDQGGRRLKLTVGTFGALNSLYWQDEAEPTLRPDEIEIKVAATGMNFKDVVIAMGQVTSPYIGIECSGTVSRVGSNVTMLNVGDRVCAMSLGAYSTYTRCPATSAARIPSDMSFEVAASIPVIFCTAYYSLMDLARIEPGEDILIHAASGGVGQAAIQLARMVGAEIYATVGSAEKKQLLTDVYGIPEDRIFYSRDTDFRAGLREATGGKGVDVVINSLAGDVLRETWDCLAPFGRFVEIGKRDITSNTRLEMAKFEHNCTFSSVDLTKVASQRPKVMGRVFSAVMDLLSRNVIQPISPITTVGISEVETALSKLRSGKTTGKIVVNHFLPDQMIKVSKVMGISSVALADSVHLQITHPSSLNIPVAGHATYLLIGGTGGIGRSITRRLVDRGAGHVVLLSRSAQVTNELDQLIQDCSRLGSSVHIKKCDAADEIQVNVLVAELQKALPPVRGVIHAAMVLKDVLFERMTFDDYDAVLRSKVYGAWNFHSALAENHLDFFVVLSSVAGIVGNRGQAAYAAANTFLDALTLHRRQKGLSSTSLDLAAIEGVGFLAENKDKQSQVMKNLTGGTLGEPELLALIEAGIDGRVGKLCGGQCVTGLDFNNPSNLPFYASESKFSILREEALAKLGQNMGSSEPASLSVSQKLLRSSTTDEAVGVVTDNLRDKLGAILMLPPEVMAAQQAASMTFHGLDSLTAIELRNWIDKEAHAHLQVLELLSCGTLKDLASLILRKTRLQGVWSSE